MDKEDQTPCLIYFNPNFGTEIVIVFNDVIPDPENPFYDNDHAPEDELMILYSEYVSGDFAKYLLEKFQFSHLKFNNEQDNSHLLMKNFDFLSRYFKLNEYAPVQNITLL